MKNRSYVFVLFMILCSCAHMAITSDIQDLETFLEHLDNFDLAEDVDDDSDLILLPEILLIQPYEDYEFVHSKSNYSKNNHSNKDDSDDSSRDFGFHDPVCEKMCLGQTLTPEEITYIQNFLEDRKKALLASLKPLMDEPSMTVFNLNTSVSEK